MDMKKLSPQLAYYYRRGKLLRQKKNKIKHKARIKHKNNALFEDAEIGYNTTTIPLSSKLIRIHAYAVLFKLQAKLDQYEVQKKLKNAGIPYRKKDRGYFFTIKGIQACISTQAVTIWAKEIDVPNDQQSLEKGYSEIEAQIASIINDINIFLELWQTVPQGVVITNHVAFVNDEGAVQKVQNNETIDIADPEDQKKRIGIDLSTGKPELEFFHRKHAKKDSRLYIEFLTDVEMNEAWRHNKAMLKDLILSQSKQVEFNDGILRSLEAIKKKLEEKNV